MSEKKKGNHDSLKPKTVDQIVWDAVVEAWRNGLSDRQAAFNVREDLGIDLTADEIKLWKKGNPAIASLCEDLKENLKAVAKNNVAKTLRSGDKDGKMSRWYLEHKCPEEFSTKSAVAFEGAVVELSLAEKEQKLQELVDNFDKEGK